MTPSSPFRICYVGGGSRFVITLLHGLAEYSEHLRQLRRPIHLNLLDSDPARCADNAAYAAIVTRQTGLVIATTVSADRSVALRDTDWVLFSAGLWDRLKSVDAQCPPPRGEWLAESGPWTAIQLAALWPFVRQLASDTSRLAPQATFSTLVNPIDVLAAAVKAQFALPTCGLCVEVPNLRGFLSYFLQMPQQNITLQHVGVNHAGYVTRADAAGQDAAQLLLQRLDNLTARDDWHPMTHDFAHCLRATGFLRTSPYHVFPFESRSWGEMRATLVEWGKRRVPGFESLAHHHQAKLQQALRDGRMVEPFDPMATHPHATPYNYPDTRHTLGALVLGLAGGQPPAAPLQVLNGRANPCAPPDTWLEVPTLVRPRAFAPQTVVQPPQWLFAHTRALAQQRLLLARWLLTGDSSLLAQAFFISPDGLHIDGIVPLIRQLQSILAQG